jgi:CheY-like chemotaxis protein
MVALHGTAVLVADDDADARELLEFLLREAGGTVRVASTANEALDILVEWTPNVLLLDLAMPETDGYSLLSRIRGEARLRAIPAVAVTAKAYPTDRARCIDAGFAEHVTKPYDGEALLDLVARLGRGTV